jgi:hypothetical protein
VKGKLVVVLLAACVVGAVGVGAAAAHAPSVKKPVRARPMFDKRFDCTRVAPASLLTSLAGGYGGTLTLKPRASWNHVADYPPKKGGTGGVSDCNYSQSTGWPDTPTSEGPVEVRIAYGTHALWWYTTMHTGAVESAAHCKTGAACTPAPLTGLGDHAYVDGGYLAVLRGKVFLLVAIAAAANADHTANVPVPDGLMVSVAQALLARLPAM